MTNRTDRSPNPDRRDNWFRGLKPHTQVALRTGIGISLIVDVLHLVFIMLRQDDPQEVSRLLWNMWMIPLVVVIVSASYWLIVNYFATSSSSEQESP